MKEVIWSDLTSDQIKEMLLLDNPVIREMLSKRLRKQEDNLTTEDIFAAWSRIVKIAQNILHINLIGPTDANGLEEAIYRLIAKEFPYGSSNTI